MPDLRARETNLRNQIHALDAQLADREAYLTLAADLEGFLAQLARQRRDLHRRTNASGCSDCSSRTSSSDPRRSPSDTASRSGERTTGDAEQRRNTDTEGDHQPHCPLRWRRHRGPLRGAPVALSQGPVRQCQRRGQPPLHIQHHPRNIGVGFHRLDHESVIDAVERSPVLLPASRTCRRR